MSSSKAASAMRPGRPPRLYSPLIEASPIELSAHLKMLLPAGLFLLASLVASIAIIGSGFLPLFLAHVFFALAALPLMLAAILHFVPVLTRSTAPSPPVAAMPWLAALGGLGAVAALAGVLPHQALPAAALLAGGAAVTVLLWIIGRLRRTLGAPHPGTRWYVVSLTFLLLALTAVAGIVLDVERYLFWRQLHLHANLFGWVGLTALGTLPVLLPTALKRPDAGAARRLRNDLPLAAGGVLALAVGAALGWPVLAAGGAAALFAVIVRDLAAWVSVFGGRALRRGAAASLSLASAFFLVLLLAGAAHGFWLLPSARLVPAFIFGFLLPLVGGALTQLLPVWRFPGPQSPARDAFAAALARYAAWRGLIFVLAGSLQLFGGRLADWGVWLAAAGLLAFLAALAGGWRQRA